MSSDLLEGALTRIVVDSTTTDLTTPDKVDRAVDGAIALATSLYWQHMWVPREYCTVEYLMGQDERVMVFETWYGQRSRTQLSGHWTSSEERIQSCVGTPRMKHDDSASARLNDMRSPRRRR